jgi:hypothetical protein
MVFTPSGPVNYGARSSVRYRAALTALLPPGRAGDRPRVLGHLGCRGGAHVAVVMQLAADAASRTLRRRSVSARRAATTQSGRPGVARQWGRGWSLRLRGSGVPVATVCVSSPWPTIAVVKAADPRGSSVASKETGRCGPTELRRPPERLGRASIASRSLTSASRVTVMTLSVSITTFAFARLTS